ncbi:MAG: hypothetical protein Phyf2KO_22250 [Phycisphaerales bacterium]
MDLNPLGISTAPMNPTPSQAKPSPPLSELGLDEYDISEFGKLGTVTQYLLLEHPELQTAHALRDAFGYTSNAFNKIASGFDVKFNSARLAWATIGQSHNMYSPDDELLVFSRSSREHSAHVDIVVLKHGGWVSRVTISNADFESRYSSWSQYPLAE